ncbi:lipoprotein [Longimycelium tulufanense]|uniref:Lipoprotein n=1 Tax=Longimycelium tulufanense TaxID=907463 RepID=A0A8J3C8E2_9PSEU|nr:lipoprotein [Longimycelium tulufanense]
MAVLVATAATTISLVGPASAEPAPVRIPDGVTAGYLVLDRTTGQARAKLNEQFQFRSASLVKLLIAIDYLERLGPDAQVPEEDLGRLQRMLRSSDDYAASELWVLNGWNKIIERSVPRIGLRDTEPPVDRRFWGYTAISARDVARTYQFILDKAQPRTRDVIMTNLRQATKCAADGFDQHFGIPRVLGGRWAIKQGWSGFGEAPEVRCVDQKRAVSRSRALSGEAQDAEKDAPSRLQAPFVEEGLDTKRRAMHTSGTHGKGDQDIIVILSLQPEGTSYDESANRLTALTKAVHLASQPA